MPAAASPFSHCVPSLWQYTTTRAAAFDALCRRAASGVPMSIQVGDLPGQIADRDRRLVGIRHAARKLDALAVFEQIRQHPRDQVFVGL